MSILEQSQVSREIATESREGGSFFKSQDPLEKPRYNYDFYSLSRSIGQVEDLVTELASGTCGKFTEAMLTEEVKHVEESLESHLLVGTLIVGAATQPLAAEIYQKALQTDFAVMTHDEQVKPHRYKLPPGTVTAARVLARKELEKETGKITERIYRPVVDLRVKTSADRTVDIYNAQTCQVEEKPSIGHWFRFSLIGIDLMLTGDYKYNG